MKLSALIAQLQLIQLRNKTSDPEVIIQTGNLAHIDFKSPKLLGKQCVVIDLDMSGYEAAQAELEPDTETTQGKCATCNGMRDECECETGDDVAEDNEPVPANPIPKPTSIGEELRDSYRANKDKPYDGTKDEHVVKAFKTVIDSMRYLASVGLHSNEFYWTSLGFGHQASTDAHVLRQRRALLDWLECERIDAQEHRGEMISVSVQYLRPAQPVKE